MIFFNKTNDKKLIAIVLPDLRGGGAERVYVDLSHELVARGYAVEFVLLRQEGIFIEQIPLNAKIINLNSSRLRYVLLPLIRYLRQAKPAGIIVAMWPLTIVAIIAAKLSGIFTRTLVCDHSDFSIPLSVKNFPYFFLQLTIAIIYRLADKIAGVSKGVSETICRLGCFSTGRVVTIYNGINLYGILKKTEVEVLPGEIKSPGIPVLIAIGNLKEEKDYENLIEAFSLARNIRPMRLIILGEGSLRSQIEQDILKHHLEKDVKLMGFISNPYPYLKAADLFVLSSLVEGLPTVLLEALACGVPVVSTDCKSGPREILEDGRYGSLVPIKDPVALSQAILAALDKPHDREALVARAKEFSVERCADEYLKHLFPKLEPRNGD